MKDHVFLQSSLLVAVLAFGGVLLWTNAPRRVAAVVVAPLFVGCLQYSVIGACLRRTQILSDVPVWLRKLGTLIFPVWIAISVPIAFGPMGILILLGTLLVGNIQVPVVLARIGLPSLRLSGTEIHKVPNDDNNEHLAPALKIFYRDALHSYMHMRVSTLPLPSEITGEGTKCPRIHRRDFSLLTCTTTNVWTMEDGVLAQEDLNLVTCQVHG